MLAVLKAGGAFVAVEASYPPDRRLVNVISDAGSTSALTSRSLLHLLDKLIENITEVGLEFPDRARLEDTVASLLSTSVKSSNTAYAIFTLGSTGKPESILIDYLVSYLY